MFLIFSIDRFRESLVSFNILTTALLAQLTRTDKKPFPLIGWLKDITDFPPVGNSNFEIKLCVKMSMSPALSSSLRVYPIRLGPKVELKSRLIRFVNENNLKAAFVLTCVGSVTKATLRFAEKEDGSPKDVSLTNLMALKLIVESRNCCVSIIVRSWVLLSGGLASPTGWGVVVLW